MPDPRASALEEGKRPPLPRAGPGVCSPKGGRGTRGAAPGNLRMEPGDPGADQPQGHRRVGRTGGPALERKETRPPAAPQPTAPLRGAEGLSLRGPEVYRGAER